MRNKLLFTILVCAALLFSSLLSGCSSSNKTNESSTPSVSISAAATAAVTNNEKKLDPVKADWYVDLSWWKYDGDLGKDKFSLFIKDKFGLDINFITPATDDGQKMAAMMASNTLPDIITYEGWKDDPGYKLYKGGFLMPMDQLIEKYTPEFKDNVYKDIADWYRQSDGHFYGLPNYAYSKFELKSGEKLEPNSSFTFRKDIMDKLGNPDVSTAEKFMNVLDRVKNEVKSYDGKPLIPLQLYEFTDRGSGSINWLQQYFSTPFEDKAGHFLDVRFQDNYYQSIKFLNEAYRKGLISQDNFTDKRDQINEKVASGKVFAMLTASQDFDAHYRTLYRADNKAQYEAFALRNYKGEEPYLQDLRGYGWLLTSVNKKTKYPDRIAKLIAFLNSKEGQYMTAFGWEGETYTKNPDGTLKYTDAYNKGMESGETTKKYGVGFSLQQDWLTIRDLYEKPTKPEDLYTTNIKKPLVQYSYDFNAANPKFNPENPKYNEMTELKNKLDLLWGRYLPKMILADSEVKSRQTYDDAITKMKQAGWDKLDAFNQEMYQQTKKRLGIDIGWPGNRK